MNFFQKKLLSLSQKQDKFNLADFSNFLTNDENSGSSSVIRNKMLVTDDNLEKLDLSKMTELELFKYNLDNENAYRKKERGEQRHREFLLKKKWEEENKTFFDKATDAIGDTFGSIGKGIFDNPLTRGIGDLSDSISSIYKNRYLYLIGIIFIIIIIKKA